MATPVWQTTTIPDHFNGDFNKRYVEGYVKYLQSPNLLFRRLGNIINTNRPNWKGTITTLMGNWGEVAEGIQEAPPVRPEKVRDLNLRVRLIKGVLVVSRELFEDDKASGYNYVNGLIPQFSQRGPKKMELDFVNAFINNGFTYDAERDLRDGVALYSTAHTAGNTGITYGNTPATAGALSESTLAQAIGYYWGGIYNDAGELDPMLDIKKFVLVVHPSKVIYAQQLVKSLSSTSDYKNSGVINPVSSANGLNIEVLAAPFQTSPTQWSLFPETTNKEDGGLAILMRTAPGAPERIDRQNPDQVQWQGRMRYAMGSLNPRWAYSNSGQ